jgi:chorismate dehydratase
VGAVSYLNTKPLIYGLEQGMMKEQVDLILDYPAKIAQMLVQDEIDMGLVPVAIIPHLKEYHIVSDYGICSDGPVASVCLFSEVPLEEIDTVLLDYQSRTSVMLARILMREYWKIEPRLLPASEDFRQQIKGRVAGVVIGDRALEQRLQSTYVYDLGEAWKAFTGLPFVFATWISNKPLPEDFIGEFNAVNQYGLDRLEEVIAKYSNSYLNYDLKKYYKINIIYLLSTDRIKGLFQFLDFI